MDYMYKMLYNKGYMQMTPEEKEHAEDFLAKASSGFIKSTQNHLHDIDTNVKSLEKKVASFETTLTANNKLQAETHKEIEKRLEGIEKGTKTIVEFIEAMGILATLLKGTAKVLAPIVFLIGIGVAVLQALGINVINLK